MAQPQQALTVMTGVGWLAVVAAGGVALAAVLQWGWRRWWWVLSETAVVSMVLAASALLLQAVARREETLVAAVLVLGGWLGLMSLPRPPEVRALEAGAVRGYEAERQLRQRAGWRLAVAALLWLAGLTVLAATVAWEAGRLGVGQLAGGLFGEPATGKTAVTLLWMAAKASGLVMGLFAAAELLVVRSGAILSALSRAFVHGLLVTGMILLWMLWPTHGVGHPDELYTLVSCVTILVAGITVPAWTRMTIRRVAKLTEEAKRRVVQGPAEAQSGSSPYAENGGQAGRYR